jgi:hypothetical protein
MRTPFGLVIPLLQSSITRNYNHTQSFLRRYTCTRLTITYTFVTTITYYTLTLQSLITRSRRLTSQLSLLSQIIARFPCRDFTRRTAPSNCSLQTERVNIFVPLITLQSDQRTHFLFSGRTLGRATAYCVAWGTRVTSPLPALGTVVSDKIAACLMTTTKTPVTS